jgi:hypothetical protein
MRDESAVLLQKCVVALRIERESGGVAKRFKPDDSGNLAMRGWSGLDAKMQLT